MNHNAVYSRDYEHMDGYLQAMNHNTVYSRDYEHMDDYLQAMNCSTLFLIIMLVVSHSLHCKKMKVI